MHADLLAAYRVRHGDTTVGDALCRRRGTRDFGAPLDPAPALIPAEQVPRKAVRGRRR